MRTQITALLTGLVLILLTASAQAQVRFDLYSNPYTGPAVNISVGQPQPGIVVPVLQQPYYYPNYPVAYPMPVVRRRGHRGYQAPVMATSHWCAVHRVHCTHAPYSQRAARQDCQPQVQYRNPYWCQPHREYCTHG